MCEASRVNNNKQMGSVQSGEGFGAGVARCACATCSKSNGQTSYNIDGEMGRGRGVGER